MFFLLNPKAGVSTLLDNPGDSRFWTVQCISLSQEYDLKSPGQLPKFVLSSENQLSQQ